MRFANAAALLLAVSACTEPPRATGSLRTLDDLVPAARAGDADATASIVLRGQQLPWQSSGLVQEPDRDGLVVQPAFADARPAAFVTTEIWDGFPRGWAQPSYVPVTGFHPVTGPVRFPDSPSISGSAPRSRCYTPSSQTYVWTLPAGTGPHARRS